MNIFAALQIAGGGRSLPKNKQRLDVRLVEEGFCPSREKARAAVMAGLVFVDGVKSDKPGLMINNTSLVELRGDPAPYASRGGIKLEKAIRVFGLDLRDRVVLDVGASTGGFTDCVLKHGARLVYAVDVGYGQLAWKLRKDPRVVVMERTNVRYLTAEAFETAPDFATVDVSFISLKIVLPVVGELTTRDAEGVVLVKPQFEAGRHKVGKKGVVRDPAVQTEVMEDIVTFIKGCGWRVAGVDFSPVKGPEGNIEFFIYYRKSGEDVFDPETLKKVVALAHTELE